MAVEAEVDTLKATRQLCPTTVDPRATTTTVVAAVVVASGVMLVAVMLSMLLLIIMAITALVCTLPFPRQRVSMPLEVVGVVDVVDGAEVRPAEVLVELEDVEALAVRPGEVLLEARRPLDRRRLERRPPQRSSGGVETNLILI